MPVRFFQMALGGIIVAATLGGSEAGAPRLDAAGAKIAAALSPFDGQGALAELLNPREKRVEKSAVSKPAAAAAPTPVASGLGALLAPAPLDDFDSLLEGLGEARGDGAAFGLSFAAALAGEASGGFVRPLSAAGVDPGAGALSSLLSGAKPGGAGAAGLGPAALVDAALLGDDIPDAKTLDFLADPTARPETADALATPLPPALLLMGLGLAGLAFASRRKPPA